MAIASPLVRGSMPSLNVSDSGPARGTLAAPESGDEETRRGGSMSGGPPVGMPFLAQPAERSAAARKSRRRSGARPRFALSESGPRVRQIVGLPQAGARDVGVPMRGAKRPVAEHLLDRAEVGAAVEQMRGERMAQRVRRDAEALSERGEP